MNPSLVVGITLIATALPVVAAAQSSSPTTGDLSIERKQRRSIVLPKPSPEQVRADADRAVSEFAATQGPRRVVRETDPTRPAARPDLDYDVKSGIQTQRLNEFIRR